MENNSILCVVVLYKEQLARTNIYQSLVPVIERMPFGWTIELFIYDNSPTEQKINIFIPVTYIHNSQNPGLSVAYNTAAQYAVQQGISWLLLLDQDTTLPPDFLIKTIHAIASHPLGNLFAPVVKSQRQSFISPFRLFGKVGIALHSEVGGIISTQKYAVINSGIMITVASFKKVGGYCDSVKLDFSDTVFIERYAKKYPTLYITDAVCIQQLSTFDSNTEEQIKRFALFCQSAKSCPKESVSANIGYFVVAFKRMCSLLLKIRSIRIIQVFWMNYVKE